MRKRLSGPFFNIASAWQRSVAEQRALLGWPVASTYRKYKAGEYGALSFDTLTRLSLILGIYKSFQVLYAEQRFADGWVRLPNSNPVFGGASPLTLMTDSGVDGLYRGVAAARQDVAPVGIDRHRLSQCPASGRGVPGVFPPEARQHVRVGGHYEFRWEGRPEPVVSRL